MYFPEPTLTNILIGSGTLISSIVLISRELNPSTQMGYSKFAKSSKAVTMVPSKQGMLIIYSPSLLLCFLGCLWSLSQAAHVKLVAIFSLVHFLKRIYEVLCVHRYSGHAILKDNIVIACSYAGFSLTQLYFTSLVPPSETHRKEIMLGVILFFVGEGLNHYHHLILANLRKDGAKEYKIPSGGLFDYIWCPHYLGEIIAFVAMTLLSQHMNTLIFQLSSASYLAVRAYNTRLWYQQKFSDVAKKACLVPGLF
ncbi:3-oxo-5-alpha-steroid 4-dehydrogenase-domain-containing protein [Absidia repens]|uniref:3-oxo-5-alpha-steroid 4-dehydrogenase-domain-containing protein n=1 Tax=Absidia repens TaxID=90262 RepID=A0A1X2IBZ4_9FUNG|nr:3-oxo-5-alpha-steroid 4-dehydrogenase-domain-containing protein [Absidia repens]